MGFDVTPYLVKDAVDKTAHGQEITVNTIEQSLWNPLFGNSNNAIIKTELKTDREVRTVEMHMRGLARGAGVEGNDDFESNEDNIEYLSQQIDYDLTGNSIPSKNRKIQSKTAVDNFRNDAKDALQDWATDRGDRTVFARLSQNCTNIVAASASGFHAGKNDTTSIIAGDYFNTKVIEECKRRALVGKDGENKIHPRIRPYIVKIGENNGVPVYEKIFLMAIGTNSAMYLQDDPLWIEAQKMAASRGENNNLFTGMLGKYKGVALVDFGTWSRDYAGILTASVGNYRDVSGLDQYAGAGSVDTEINLFLGASAGLNPFDEGFSYYEEPFDSGRKMRVSIDRGWAFAKTHYVGKTDEEKKSVWHGKDYGVIAAPAAI